MKTIVKKKSWKLGRLSVVFDPHDEHTPFMVYMKLNLNHELAQTYWCAFANGSVEDEPMTHKEYSWLQKLLPEIEEIEDKLGSRE